MKHIAIKVFAVVLFISILISCKKSSSNGGGVVISGNTQTLTQQPWKITKFYERVNFGSLVDVFPSEPPCTQDDEYIFSSNNTYELIEGATKCNPPDPDVINVGIWQFTQGETKLNVDGVEYTIGRLDNATLVLFGTVLTPPDTRYDSITLAH